MVPYEFAIVVADASDLIPALVSVEAKLFPLLFDFLRLLRQHIVEGFLFVLEQVVFEFVHFHVVLEATPFVYFFSLEELFLLLNKCSFLLNIMLLSTFS